MTLGYPARRIPAALRPTALRLAPRLADSYVRVMILALTGMGDDNPGEARLAPVNAASGILIAPGGYVLTAAHITVRAGNRARITTRDGHVHTGRVLRVDRDRELALLVAPGLGAYRRARLSAAVPARGATLLAIGTPAGRAGVVSAGTVDRGLRAQPIRYADFSYPHALEVRLRAEPGDSGGPLFNTRGELVGMIASFAINRTGGELSNARATAYAVPAADIARYLDEALGPRWAGNS